MSSKSKNGKRLLSLLLLAMLVVSMITMAIMPASAEVNEQVREDTNGVFQVRAICVVSGDLKDGSVTHTFKKDQIPWSAGSAFLINNTTLLTCNHVVDPDVFKESIESYGLELNEVKYEIVVNKDVTIGCTLKNRSAQDDYAILTLNESLGGKSILKLADSSLAAPTQRVYALGFPAVITDFQQAVDSQNVTYDRDDVTITEGDIQKLVNLNNTDVIQNGCAINNGNSGGPLVDEEGNVLGIIKWNITSDNSWHYATAINEVKKVLDSLVIEYTPAGHQPTVETQTEAETEALTEAATTEATQAITEPTTDSAVATTTNSDDGMDMTKLIIIIAIAVLVIAIIVVVLIIVLNSKKKGAKTSTPPAGGTVMPGANVNRSAQPPYGAQPYNRPPVASPTAPTAPSNEGAGETSVLNDGAGETTVLGNQAAGYSMTRTRNGEKIVINKPEFMIGKERRRVDYCISDNNSISRVHAKIKVRAGRCYITDLGSTNCTYVNGVKLSPNQEVILSKGDKIKISDEEFEFIG